jgi:transcriptional regulator with XRE-family HTH domain
MFDMEACGDRIRSLRREKAMTQEALAERLNVSAYHFRRIENGKEGASIDLLIDIAELFGVSLDYLILGRKNTGTALKKDLLDLAGKLRCMVEEL